MTVSRTLQITYDAPDLVTAAWLDDFVTRIVANQPWGTFADVETAQRFLPTLTNQSFMAGPVMPGDPAWVASDGG